jgi:hypothetical protein
MIMNVNKIFSYYFDSFLWFSYLEKKQISKDAIKVDELLINDIERRLKESKSLSDQEEILQILQQNISSKLELKENDW